MKWDEALHPRASDGKWRGTPGPKALRHMDRPQLITHLARAKTHGDTTGQEHIHAELASRHPAPSKTPFSGYKPDAGRFQFMSPDQLESELRVHHARGYSTGIKDKDETDAIRAEIARRKRA